MMWNINISIEGNGMTDCPMGGMLCQDGDIVCLHATPLDGWSFDGWYEGDISINKESTLKIDSIDRDYNMRASFVPLFSQQEQPKKEIKVDFTTEPPKETPKKKARGLSRYIPRIRYN